MANSLGALVVSLGLDSAEFTRGMTKAEYEANRALGRIKQEAADMGKIIALAAVAAGAAAIKMGADFISAAADLDDLAEKTGASVEELSKLAQQARISGADMGTIEMGLIRLGKALNENDEEAKKATKALEALGLKAADLKGLDTAEALKIVAAEMNKYGDSSGKTALALDLFGKSGAQLLPILKDMANDGELAGTVTAKQAAEAEELGKSYRRLINDARNIGQAFALDLVPWLQKMIEQFTEGTRVAGGFWNAIRLFGFSTITTGNAPEKIRDIGDAISELQGKRERFIAQGREGWTKTIDAQIEDLKKQQEYAKILTRQIDPGRGWDEDAPMAARPMVYKPSATTAKAVRAVKDDSDKLAREAERALQAQLAVNSRLHSADVKAFQDYRDQIKKIADEMKEREYFENIFGKEATEGMSIGDLKAKLQSTIDGAQALKDEWDRAGLAAGGFDETGKKIIDTLDKATDSGKAFGQHMSSALEDLIFKGDKSISVMKLLEAAALDVGKALFRENVTNPLSKAGAGLFDQLFKGGLGSMFGGGTPAYDMSFATGTDYVPRTGFALVHKGERITPAGQNGGGAVNIYITNDNRGADVGAVARMEMANAQLRRDIVPIVRNAQRRTV